MAAVEASGSSSGVFFGLGRGGGEDLHGGSDSEPSVTVTFRFMDGTTRELVGQASLRLYVLRYQLHTQLGVALARIRLIAGTRVLRDYETVADVDLQDGAVINVVVLPPLYEGSALYDRVAQAYSDSRRDVETFERPSEEEVQAALAAAMERKVSLHDSLTAKVGALKTTETKKGSGGADPEVVKIYEKAWDDNAGDKDKICTALGLAAEKWTEGLDKAAFAKKFLG